MSSHQPCVTIAMPVYNGEEYMREALDSVLSQTFDDLEIIISDNASTDKTEDICREYAENNSHIRYYRNDKNVGAIENFNRLFALSNGKYFQWVSYDDKWSPNFLEDCVAALEKDNSIVLCYGKTEFINSDGDYTRTLQEECRYIDCSEPHKRFRDILIRGTSACPSQIFGLIRADTLRKTSLMGEYYGSDRVILSELSLLGKFKRLDSCIYYRRLHNRQSVRLNPLEKAKWINPQGKRGMKVEKAVYEYVSTVNKSNIGIYHKAVCYFSIAQLSVKNDKWKKLLLPGPNNYFGFFFKGS